MLTADTSSNGRGAAGRRALRLLAAAGAAAVAGAPGASAEGPWVKAKVKVSSEEICVPSGPAYAKLRDGTEIYVPKGGMLYIKKNDTEVETYIKKPDLPIPIPTGIMPALLGDSIAIVSEGSTTQLSFNLPGLTDGREDTEVVNLTGWVSFDTSGCGGVGRGGVGRPSLPLIRDLTVSATLSVTAAAWSLAAWVTFSSTRCTLDCTRGFCQTCWLADLIFSNCWRPALVPTR